MRRAAKSEEKGFPYLLHDVERYYGDHLLSMELMWPKERSREVAAQLESIYGYAVPGRGFAGMVIPSMDRDAVYVRVQNGNGASPARPKSYLAQRIPLTGMPASFLNLVLEGVQARIAWAFVRKIWAQIDAKSTHYELSRPELPGLLRRARLRGLMDFVGELVLTEVAPCLKGYFYGPEIGAIFAERLAGSILEVEHPDEQRGLDQLKAGLVKSLEAAEVADPGTGGCFEA